MPTMEKARTQDEVESETISSDEQPAPQQVQRRGKKTRVARRPRPKQQQQQQSGPLDQLPIAGDLGNTVNNTLGGVTGALGSVTNNAVNQQQGGGDKKSDTLRLRLDLNLDIEIQLKARIHGDLELALLN